MNATEDDDHCLVLPPRVNSPGFSAPESLNHGVLQYSLPQLEIQIILILFLTQLCHSFLKRLGLTPIVSQLLVGIVFSSACTGRSEAVQRYLFPDKWKTNSIIDTLGVLDYMFFLFITGVKMDMSMVWTVGKKSWAIGIGTTLVPLFLGSPAVMFLFNNTGLSSMRTETLRHPLNEEHELVLIMRMMFTCDECQKDGQVWSYYCENCDFVLHPKCALKAEEEEEAREEGEGKAGKEGWGENFNLLRKNMSYLQRKKLVTRIFKMRAIKKIR